MARQVMNPNFFKKKTVAAPAATVNVLPEDTSAAAPVPAQPQQPAPKPAAQTPQPAQNPAAPATKPAAPAKKPAQQRQQVIKTAPKPGQAPAQKPQQTPEKPPEKVFIRLGHKTAIAMREAAEALRDISQPKLADGIEQITKDVARDKFTVAVVGEFSRGKSTFINRLLGKDILPTGDMPTTALPTRVRYNPKEVLAAFDEKGRRMKAVPLSEEAWEGLTTDHFGGDDPKGTVVIGAPSPWLMRSGIELMDTPGAGDLEEDRIKVISDALLQADAAVIAISATLPLSMSEKFFIEQRLIAHKTPFMMIIVTKMDQIPVSRRNDMLDYFAAKLKQWNMNIPVFVPYDMEMPDDRYKTVVGMDKVRRQLEVWVRDPQRVRLTEAWAAARAEALLDMGISFVRERLCLLDADDDKRLALIEEKKRQLSKAQSTWKDLRSQMRDRCDSCFDRLSSRANDYASTITERLQYEAAHASNPKKWWTEDYPYRLKVELTNMSVGINDTVSRQITEDTAWFNRSLDKCFKTYVLIDKGTVMDKNQLVDIRPGQDVKLESLDEKRSAARIAISAASIAGAVALNVLGAGFLSVVATMGVNTGGSLFSEYFFKQKVEKQREEMKAAIAKNVPQLIAQSVSESEGRLRQIYRGIISEAVEKEKAWLDAQTAAIEGSMQSQTGDQRSKLSAQYERLENARERLRVIGNV